MLTPAALLDVVGFLPCAVAAGTSLPPLGGTWGEN